MKSRAALLHWSGDFNVGATAMNEDKPNIVLFITEQHRGDCLGIENHPVLMTPNMDAIAGAGVRFTRATST